MFETDELDRQLVLRGLHEQAGRSKAMLEVQIWAEVNKDMLRTVGLHESLLKLTRS